MAAQVVEVMRQRNARGQTIVMVTHDPTVAAAATRCLTMRDGRIVRDAPPDLLAPAELVKNASKLAPGREA